MKKIIYIIVFFAFQNVFAQYNEMSDQDLVLRMWKTYGYTSSAVNDKYAISEWLSFFDPEYNSYYKNEFKMKEKTEKAIADINAKLNSLSDYNIYCYYGTTSFGDYDFDLNQFRFGPLSNISIEEPLRRKSFTLGSYFITSMTITDLNFVGGIPMAQNDAELFLSKKEQKNIWGQTYNNRKVYTKIFYYHSIEDRFSKSSNQNLKQYIKGTPIFVQIFNDDKYKDFLYEWWNPNVSDYYKQQLINNNVPKNSFYTQKPITTEIETGIYDNVDIMPSYKGGTQELLNFISNNLVYPKPAMENNLEGDVFIKFYIDENGKINNPQVIKDRVGGGCAEEAVKLIQKMPLWNPGLQNGKKVKVYYTLPITFKKSGKNISK